MNIPVIVIQTKTIAEAVDKSLHSLYKNGCDIRTQYDKEGDPPSKDCTLNLTIDEPLSDPMIHKCFPGSIGDLREYLYELDGYKNRWVKDMSNKNDTKWEYLYSSRITNWGRYKENNSWAGYFDINQIEEVINKLKKQPFTRQAQIITWYPPHDLYAYDCPCLQSLHFRIVGNTLNVNVRFRSEDAYGAFLMNCFGLVWFIKNNILNKIDETLMFGRLNWQVDSFHIYGKDLKDIKPRLIDKIEANQPFEKRVYNFSDPTIQEMYTECEQSILDKIKVTEDGFKQQYNS